MIGRRRIAVSALAAAMALAGAGTGGTRADSVDVLREAGATRHLATLDGRVIDIALPSRPGAFPSGLLLLVRPAEPGPSDAPPRKLPACPDPGGVGTSGPARLLYRFDPRDDGRLEQVRDDLPAEAGSIDRLDLDGDGRDELAVGLPGAIWLFHQDDVSEPWRGEPRRIADQRFAPDPDGLAGEGAAPTGLLGSVALGSLTLYGPIEESPGFGRRLEVALPLAGIAGSSGLRVESRVPVRVGTAADGRRIFATAPERFGGRRLRTQRIEIAPDGKSRAIECWAALPEPEDLLESEFLWIDDEPVLLVTSKQAGKLALFGEKRLRLFRLKADRGRTGYAPMFAVETRANLWQSIWPRMHDADGDGHPDLVLGYWKGLKDDKVVLDVYLRRPGLTFEPTPRSTAFDVPAGDRSYLQYGIDLDGDGPADLVLLDSIGRMLHYPGRDSRTGRKLVDRSSSRAILVTDGLQDGAEQSVVIGSAGVQTFFGDGSRPRRLVTDLDGDGRAEIVLIRGGSATGGATVAVVRF